MFTNPNTIWIEVLVLVITAIFLMSILGVYIYKKIHHLPVGECANCHKSKKQLLDEYHKFYCQKECKK